ncbi:MAG TPA: type VI secretion system baseplate subunit TssE [Stellaceae bacterium]
MAELTQQERLQPCLLDRITDDAPEKLQESRDERVVSLRRLREGVLRDLGWLLNAANMASLEDLTDHPHVAQSVLNYGMPGIAGSLASGIDVADLERKIYQAIVTFEPRILRDTLKVRLAVAIDQMAHNAMTFEIEGQLWAQPVPQRIYLKTEIDLELGEVKLSDYTGGSAG